MLDVFRLEETGHIQVTQMHPLGIYLTLPFSPCFPGSTSHLTKATSLSMKAHILYGDFKWSVKVSPILEFAYHLSVSVSPCQPP